MQEGIVLLLQYSADLSDMVSSSMVRLVSFVISIE